MSRKPNFKSSVASRLFGRFASTKFPSFLQNLINKSYVLFMGVDMREYAPATSFKSLNALFTRALTHSRELAGKKGDFISPCDALISACGKIVQDRAMQIKGFEYRVGELLGSYISKAHKEKLLNGDFINFYLSPKDYHRYHVPLDLRVAKAVHIPGKLYPVNFTWLVKIPELFCENERVILECYTKEEKLFYIVCVGALNVGKMRFTFDERITTNARSSMEQPYMYEQLWLKKGNELGRFEMGSTIVMLFERDMIELSCHRGDTIRFGELIATSNVTQA